VNFSSVVSEQILVRGARICFPLQPARVNYVRKRGARRRNKSETDFLSIVRGSVVLIPTGTRFDQLVIFAAAYLHILQPPGVHRKAALLSEGGSAVAAADRSGRFRLQAITNHWMQLRRAKL
jgi:hypothetical protein